MKTVEFQTDANGDYMYMQASDLAPCIWPF